MRLLVFVAILAIVTSIGGAAENATPPAKPVPPKLLTPLEMFRDFERQQGVCVQQAQQLQTEFNEKLKGLQTSFDQLEGAKKLLLAQNPDLEKQLEPKKDVKTP
jgi:TolA-binding protein